MKRLAQGYLRGVIPDDTAGPLTPGERAAIADLERRLLLTTPVPGHDRPRPTRLRAVRRQSALPIVALLATTCALVALVIAIGGGPLGTLAVVASVAGTAAVWPLLPARFGGPVRLPLRLLRPRNRRPGRS